MVIRRLERRDVPELFAMVRELAEFENLSHVVRVTAEDLERAAFSTPPLLQAHVAERDGRLVGYAVYCYVYYTFTGRWLYLDDLFVRPEARSTGVGRALLGAAARDALEAGCCGMTW